MNFNTQQVNSTRLHKDINNYLRCIRGGFSCPLNPFAMKFHYFPVLHTYVLPCDMKVVFLGQWQRPTVKVHFGCDIGDQDYTQLDKMIGNKLQNDLSISTG